MKYFIFLSFTLFSEVLLAASSWEFTTPLGQIKKVSYERDDFLYSISSEDVTVKVDSCQKGNYRICFMTSYLDVAIPVNPPNLGDVWVVMGTKFELRDVISKLDLLGHTYRDVMMIHVERDQNFYLQIPKIKNSYLMYSYEFGLLMF